MSLRRMFPLALAVCFVLSCALAAHAQQTTTRPRTAGYAAQPAATTNTTTTTETNGRLRLENDLKVITPAEAEEEEGAPGARLVSPLKLGQVERLMLTAIEGRLGVPYRMGAEGPNRYDCSGFVWSVFQAAGVGFERGSARTLWNSFAPASELEKFQFGTLVFFNHLNHVGIVADAGGFYHASSSRGVVYSPFSEYWTKRISGFRRAPLARPQTLLASTAGR